MDAVAMFPHLFAGVRPAQPVPAAPGPRPAVAPDGLQLATLQQRMAALLVELQQLGQQLNQLLAGPLAPGALPAGVQPAGVLPIAGPLPVQPAGIVPAPPQVPPAPPPPPAPAPPPPPPPVAVQPVAGPAPLRTVRVSDSASLASAMASAKPGDRIELASGSYTLPARRFSLVGTAAAPITIAAAPGATATIEGGTNTFSMQLDRCEYLTVSGLRFAKRGPTTMRALNVTDSNHVQIVGNWIGPGGEGQHDASPIHFGADGSGRTNNHNLVANNTIYATAGHLASHCVYFGSGGGTDIQIVGNDLHFAGPASVFPAMIQFNPGNEGTYRGVVIRGNTLTSDTGGGGGFALNAVSDIEIANNTLRLKRDASGKGGAVVETWRDGNPSGQVSGLRFHDNDVAYDSPARGGRASFVVDAPTQASFANNRWTGVPLNKEGAYAAGLTL